MITVGCCVKCYEAARGIEAEELDREAEEAVESEMARERLIKDGERKVEENSKQIGIVEDEQVDTEGVSNNVQPVEDFEEVDDSSIYLSCE
jgi:hypothetical protein